jgi:tRNA (guanosine-2'-O-)-methyltransferase
VKPLGGTDIKRLHREWRRKLTRRLDLVLDDVTSPFNVGAIIRTAAAYRVEHLWLGGDTPDPSSAKVGKTALGTERYLRWSHHADGATAVAAAGAGGLRVVGLELVDGAVPLFDIDLTGDVALVVGHEDRGVRRATLEACDEIAYLPQAGRVGSLNVASATAIACWEARRQEWRLE